MNTLSYKKIETTTNEIIVEVKLPAFFLKVDIDDVKGMAFFENNIQEEFSWRKSRLSLEKYQTHVSNPIGEHITEDEYYEQRKQAIDEFLNKITY